MRVMAVFSMRSLEVSEGKFGGTTVISGSLHSTLLQDRGKQAYLTHTWAQLYIKITIFTIDLSKEV